MPMPRRPFPYDRRMPEIPKVLDCAIVGPLLRHHLFARRGQAADIEECRVVRIRYRPERRFLTQYSVSLRDACTGRSSTHFVTGSLYADTQRAARRARRLPDAAFIPELRMLVSMLPFDPKLPQAHTLLSADDPELQAAVLRSVGGGSWALENWRTEVARYREGLSLVVRLTVDARNTHTGDVHEHVRYAKAYPDADTATHMFAKVAALERYWVNRYDGPSIDAPVACLDRLSTVLFPAGLGRPLDDIIANASEVEAIAAVRDTARALARFNVSDAPTRRTYSRADYVESLRRPVGMLEWALPDLRPDLHRIRDSMLGIPEVERRPTHRDMKPEHVLISPRRLTFIDLDSAAGADPVLDIASMLARFTVLASDGATRSRARLAVGTFHEEYFRIAPAAWRARLPLYFAASLLEVAAGLFHRQTEGWQRHVPALVAAATRSLDRRDLSHAVAE